MVGASLNLGVVFSYGVSLATWHSQGNLDREILPYKLLLSRRKNLHIMLFTYGDSGDSSYLPQGVHLVAMGNVLKKFPKFFHPFVSFVLPVIFYSQFQKCDVLKTNQIWGSWVAVLASLLTRAKLWSRAGYEHYTNHLLRSSPFYKRWPSFCASIFAYQFADLITVTSIEMKDFIIRTFKVDPNIITVHGNYIDTSVFSAEAQNRITKGANSILYVGRLNLHKNIETLIRAAAISNCELTIIGKGEEEQKLHTLSKSLNARVQFIPSVPNHELPKFYQSHAIFCLPSLFEGNPKVLLEAMSCGCAVIGNNVRGIREIIKHNHDGLLFNGSVESLVEQINSLTENKSKARELGENARKKILDNFGTESYINFEENNLKKLGLNKA